MMPASQAGFVFSAAVCKLGLLADHGSSILFVAPGSVMALTELKLFINFW